MPTRNWITKKNDSKEIYAADFFTPGIICTWERERGERVREGGKGEIGEGKVINKQAWKDCEWDANGEWRRLHNEVLKNFYHSPNIVRMIKSRRWVGNIARMEESRSAIKILTGKPKGKRRFGRPRRRWEDNIRMDLEEIGTNAGNWVDSAQNRDYWRPLVNATLNLRVP